MGSDFKGAPWVVVPCVLGVILVVAANVAAPTQARPTVVLLFCIGLVLMALPSALKPLLALLMRAVLKRQDLLLPAHAARRGMTVRMTRPRRRHAALPFTEARGARDFRRAVSKDGSVEVGTFRAEYRTRFTTRSRSWSYLRTSLAAPVPHIVLDARSNNAAAWSTLPRELAPVQRLAPEGDFSRSFLLYCPVGYETDALYLFTPDVLQRLLDHSQRVDVELIGSNLFLYDRRRWNLGSAETWRTVDVLLAEVCEPISRRTRRYLDERVSPGRGELRIRGGALLDGVPPTVARRGRRLASRERPILSRAGSFALIITLVAVNLVILVFASG